MAGCDYLKNAKGIAVKTAHSLFEKFHTIQNVLSYLRKRPKNPVDENFVHAYERAYLAFRYQRVWCPIKREVVTLNDFEFAKQDIAKQLEGKSISKDLSSMAGLGAEALDRELLLKHFNLSLLEFLGPVVDRDIAEKLAMGKIDPITHKEFSEVEFVFDPRELTLQEIQGLGFRKIADSVANKKPRGEYTAPYEIGMVNLTVDFDEDAIQHHEENKNQRLDQAAKDDPQQALLRLLVSSKKGRPAPQPQEKKKILDSDEEEESELFPNFMNLNRNESLKKQTYTVGTDYSKRNVIQINKNLKETFSKFKIDSRKSLIDEKISLRRSEFVQKAYNEQTPQITMKKDSKRPTRDPENDENFFTPS